MKTKEFLNTSLEESWLAAGKWLAKSGLDENKCRIYSGKSYHWASVYHTVYVDYAEEISFSILMEFLEDKKVYLTHPDRCDYYFEGDVDGHTYSLYVKKF